MGYNRDSGCPQGQKCWPLDECPSSTNRVAPTTASEEEEDPKNPPRTKRPPQQPKAAITPATPVPTFTPTFFPTASPTFVPTYNPTESVSCSKMLLLFELLLFSIPMVAYFCTFFPSSQTNNCTFLFVLSLPSTVDDVIAN